MYSIVGSALLGWILRGNKKNQNFRKLKGNVSCSEKEGEASLVAKKVQEILGGFGTLYSCWIEAVVNQQRVETGRQILVTTTSEVKKKSSVRISALNAGR